MAGGDCKVREGKLANAMLASLAKDVEAARARLEAVDRERKARFPHLAKVVNSYCPGVARETYHIHRDGAALRSHRDGVQWRADQECCKDPKAESLQHALARLTRCRDLAAVAMVA